MSVLNIGGLTHCEKAYNLKIELIGKKAKCESCEEVFVIEECREEQREAEQVVFQKEDDIKLKPNFWSFMLLGWLFSLKTFVIFVVLMMIGSWLVSELEMQSSRAWDESVSVIMNMLGWLMGVWFFVLFIVLIWFKYIVYKKESYVITDKKLVYNFWNIFSENTVDLTLDKVTQVTNILGFWQHLFFKTWNVITKTAWSGNSTVVMKNIKLSEEQYIAVKERMKKNGFRLEMDKLVQEEKPHWLAIFWELFWKVFWTLLFLGYIALSIYLEALQGDGPDFDEISSEIWAEMWEVWTQIMAGWIGFAVLVLCVVIITAIFKYLDLSRRRYRVFTDTVTYNEWFLTKNFSFIPMENVADTENTQSFWSKIFGLHDVEVSSQWENNKVVFKNMVNGEKIMANVKYLKNAIIRRVATIEWDTNNTHSSSLVGYSDSTEKALNFDKEFQATYKMNLLKSMFWFFPLLLIPIIAMPFIWPTLLPMFGVFIAVGAHKVVQIFCTDFIVSESSIEKRFEFINTKHNSFSVEKITGITVMETLIDKIFGTCSIKFLSIWTGSNIIFQDIKKTPDLEEKILAKIWIHLDGIQKEIVSEFNFLDYIKSQIWKWIMIILFLVVISIGAYFAWDDMLRDNVGDSWADGAFMMFVFLGFVILFFPLLRFFYSQFYYSPIRYKNRIYSEALESIQGFFIKTKKYSLLRHIKSVSAKKYPLTQTWDFYFDIAGETITQVKKWSKFKQLGVLALFVKNTKKVVSKNAISIKFLKDVFSEFDKNDQIVNESPLNTDIVDESRQDIWNSIIAMIILYLIIAIPTLVFWYVSRLESMELNIIFAILWVFTFIMVAIVGIQICLIKAKRYEYQKSRILYYSGIIYKNKQSILYSNFNYVEKGRTFLNMLFKNGNIKIYTLWSSWVDMNIKDIDNFREVYELLKKD